MKRMAYLIIFVMATSEAALARTAVNPVLDHNSRGTGSYISPYNVQSIGAGAISTMQNDGYPFAIPTVSGVPQNFSQPPVISTRLPAPSGPQFGGAHGGIPVANSPANQLQSSGSQLWQLYKSLMFMSMFNTNSNSSIDKMRERRERRAEERAERRAELRMLRRLDRPTSFGLEIRADAEAPAPTPVIKKKRGFSFSLGLQVGKNSNGEKSASLKVEAKKTKVEQSETAQFADDQAVTSDETNSDRSSSQQPKGESVSTDDSEIAKFSASDFISPVKNRDCRLDQRRYGCYPHPIVKRNGKAANRFHAGWDIQGIGSGKPLVAPQDCTIESVQRKKKGYGNSMRLTCGNFEFFYTHLSKFKKTSGKVKKGEVVAFSGSTGLSNGPHLHMEIKKNGKRVDPESVFTAQRVCKKVEKLKKPLSPRLCGKKAKKTSSSRGSQGKRTAVRSSAS